jgi:hypothetical protein
MNNNEKKVFFIDYHGDPSVGIFPMVAKVTFEDPIIYCFRIRIMDIRKMLANHYDVPVEQVYTEVEWNALQDDELDKEMEQWAKASEEDEKALIEHMEKCSGCPECVL